MSQWESFKGLCLLSPNVIEGLPWGAYTATAWPYFSHSLRKLYLLLAQKRISPRRAAVSYISQLLFRTLPAIEQERDVESSPDACGPGIVMDVPRPVRTPPIDRGTQADLLS